MAMSIRDRLLGVHDDDLNLEDHAIYLMCTDSRSNGNETPDGEPGVDWTMANRFIRNLQTLQTHNPKKDILIHMNTCGGDVVQGFAIYDAIRACPNHVTIINYSHARSMSSLIFLAANKRIMMPHSYYMIHDGTMNVNGTVKSVNSYVEFEKRVYKKYMMEIYIDVLREQGRYKGRSFKWIWDMLQGHMDRKEELYLTAKEAVSWGFADSVWEDHTDWSRVRRYTKKQKDRG